MEAPWPSRISRETTINAAQDVEVGQRVLVLDFVANGPTPELAVACGGMQSAVVFIGAGAGHAKVGFGITPWEMELSNSLWGTRLELMELVEMARRKPLEIRTTPFPLELAPMAYQLLHERKIDGRAVCVP
ncbi:MAG: hypothetical protein Q4G30_05310 [Actinomycetaceae bacterium]|nr:hypothetical protein [Actinomycetaceae bacterium]